MGFRKWDALPVDLQDIVWCFCGDLRNPRHRHHKFVSLELKLWQLLRGKPVSPSHIVSQYRYFGVDRLKKILELAYFKAQREAFYKQPIGTGDFLGAIHAHASP